MHKSKLICGKHITIHQLNDFFEPVTKMVLEHFDVPQMSDSCLLLSSYCHIPIEHFRKVLPGKKIIAYQLEQLMDGNFHFDINAAVKNLRDVDEIWDYDEKNVAFLRDYCSISVSRLIPMLYTTALERSDLDRDNPEFDVIFYGILNERRWKIISDIQAKCYGQLKFAWIYGEHEMDKHIANTKVVLNLHPFEPYNRQEQVRMFQPIINGRTVVSEPSQTNNMPGEIIEVELKDMAQSLKRICSSEEWKTFGKVAKKKFQLRTEQFLNDIGNF